MVVNLNIKVFRLLNDFLFLFFTDLKIVIIVLRSVELSIPNIIICTGITRIWNVFWIFWVTFLFWSVVNRSWNYVPSYVPIWYFPLHKWSSCSKSQKTVDLRHLTDHEHIVHGPNLSLKMYIVNSSIPYRNTLRPNKYLHHKAR